MFKDKEAHFADSYLFKEKALANSSSVSEVIDLGNTEGGIRIVAKNSAIACTSGNTATIKIQSADEADSTAWTDVESKTLTASSTAIAAGEAFSVIPETKRFIRAVISNSTGMTGTVTVCEEYVPR